MNRWRLLQSRFVAALTSTSCRAAVILGAIAVVVVLTCSPMPTHGGDEPRAERAVAPDVDGGVDYLNTNAPIKIADLKGRVVILDFWTLCCINCIHVLPDLAKLEAKYPGILVVLGIHTPKFDNEKKTGSIEKAVLRYEVKHPVINDADRRIWNRYRVNSWPTLVLIDTEGKIVGRVSGEGNYDLLDQYIGKLIEDGKAKGTLKKTPIDFQLLKEKEATPLYFPGKVLADQASNRLFIADSTHHRIVITDLGGKKIDVAGAGVEGFKNGSFDDAQFSDPQGMALIGNVLYVADRKNHSIRALDLNGRTVATVAGTGKQAGGFEARFTGGNATKLGLNSPWDLLYHKDKLYIAMAGHHQIWTFDPAKKLIAPFSGDGREDLEDGVHEKASFAQPSGLATDGKHLYVADSETSSIRSVDLNPAGAAKTLVGEGLFEFGDIDGKGKDARLQHALGVAYKDGMLYVADTYNSKLKTIDPTTLQCKTFLGGDGKSFSEPAGLSFAGDKLYVADTNNHRIQVVDVKTKQTTTLPLTGLTPPARMKKQ